MRATSRRTLIALVAALGVTSVLALHLGDRPPANAPRADAAAEDAGRSYAPPHVVWNRHFALGDLMRETVAVVVATVTTVSPAPPITAADAGAAPDAPSMPRQRIGMRTDRRLEGDPGATFDLVNILLPGGVTPEEFPEYRPGQQELLFIRPSGGPAPIPGTWEIAGIDGRLPRAASGRFRALLGEGPEPQIRARWRDLP